MRSFFVMLLYYLYFCFMNYDHEILAVLTRAGEKGLKLQYIARHVYNACNSMFTPLDYKDVYAYVSQYLAKSSKTGSSFVRKTSYGVYCLNLDTTEAQQLMLQFGAHSAQDDTLVKPSSDCSLSLFDDDDF